MMPSQGLVATATDGRSSRAASPVRVSLCIFIWLATTWGYCANVAESKSQPANATKASNADTKTQAKTSAKLPEFKHGDWPFTPLARPAVPKLQKLSGWARNPID